MVRKRFFTALIAFAGILAIYSFVNVEDDPLIKIRQQLEKWTNEQPVEKVYLHIDKPYYAAGDDIWFKAYVVSGSSHQLSVLSGIVNVDLVDDRDSITRSVKLPLQFGAANGDFALPDTLHPGNYHIRAYTNYMRNAGSEYFFDKTITIINPVTPGKGLKALLVNTTGKADVQFFPEGGYLVNDIATKVAFKAIGPDGLGADIKGTITDSKGQQITQFASTHLGMGELEITPRAGVTYQANIIQADGSQNTVSLPKSTDNGYVLNITDNGAQNLEVKLTASKSLITNDPRRQLTLVAQSGGKLYYNAKVRPSAAPFRLSIPQNKFPSGIVQFTLFSPSGEPLNERLVFIRHTGDLKLAVTPDQQSYAPRQNVKITLDAHNSLNKPVTGNFSVAVIDETRVPVDEDAENNILANLLLTSDLRGYVERPAYYFNNVNDKARADLDMLMLTQGYHRFEWRELLRDPLPARKYLPENSLQVSGTILTPGGKPVANGKVKLFDLDSIQYYREAVTDAQGRFIFANLTFDDSVRFIVEARTGKNKKDVTINLDKLEPASTSGLRYSPGFQIDRSSNLSVYAQSSRKLYDEQRRYGLGNHVITLQEVMIREKKELAKYSSNLNGPGNADQIIQGKLLQGLACPNISDCLEGRLLGVVFHNGVAYSTRDNRPMQLIVDGVYVEGQYLNTLNYNDIQAIEVLRNVGLTAIYGGRGGSGVLLVTTKHGGDVDEPEPMYGRGITTYYPKGYYKARIFYSPKYDRSKTTNQLADLRTTIFWKPDLLTGTDGKASFQYFNAGGKGIYRVVIEGIDSDGNIGRQVYRYQVR